MEHMKTTKQHKLTDKHPVIAALLFCIGSFLLYIIVYTIFGVLFGQIDPGYGQPIAILCTIGAVLLIMPAYKHHFKPEYEGSMTGGDLRKAFLLILIQCAYTLLVQSIKLLDGQVFHAPTLYITCGALQAGAAEEVIFRGVMISTLMRRWKDDANRSITATFICSAAFSMVHLMNLLSGASLILTVIQVICTLFSGIFYAAVYLRTGNLLPLIAGHFFHDIMQYVISEPEAADSLLLTGDITWSGWVDLTMTIILGCIGLWLLRKDKRHEVTTIWNKKWTLSAEN